MSLGEYITWRPLRARGDILYVVACALSIGRSYRQERKALDCTGACAGERNLTWEQDEYPERTLVLVCLVPLNSTTFLPEILGEVSTGPTRSRSASTDVRL